jgi:dCMP deaminase
MELRDSSELRMTTSPSRPEKDEYFLRGAEWASTRGTCARRQVGCILVNDKGHILATGYNGPESGAPHCNERQNRDGVIIYPHACVGAFLPSGQGLEQCDAIHAEQNALLQCPDVFSIHTCYVTHSPCVHCVKLLMGTSCIRIVFRNQYAHDSVSKKKWLKLNSQNHNHDATPFRLREWLHIPGEMEHGPGT